MMFTHRAATLDDLEAIRVLMAESMARLLPAELDPEQVRRSEDVMGLDTQLVADGTYTLIFDQDTLVGCGGWSRRQTLFGGDNIARRDATLCDPARDPARIRAMYTHPDHVRRGIGSLILRLAEDAAQVEGFRTIEMGATASGRPLYEARGYRLIEDVSVHFEEGVVVPIFRMGKTL